MKNLGYPRLISVDNFRLPNFELVADILYWMTHCIDPESEISDDISTEENRVKFLKLVATIIVLVFFSYFSPFFFFCNPKIDASNPCKIETEIPL